jgi:hypothetical protein
MATLMDLSTGTLSVDTEGLTLTVEEIAARLFSPTVEDEKAELTPPKGNFNGNFNSEKMPPRVRFSSFETLQGKFFANFFELIYGACRKVG